MQYSPAFSVGGQPQLHLFGRPLERIERAARQAILGCPNAASGEDHGKQEGEGQAGKAPDQRQSLPGVCPRTRFCTETSANGCAAVRIEAWLWEVAQHRRSPQQGRQFRCIGRIALQAGSDVLALKQALQAIV
ncbi:MAG: hypothetical protein C4311_13315 [Chloroflexota bacterium]